MSDEIRPFRIDVPQADIDDLKRRLTGVRLVQELPPDETSRAAVGIPVPPGWEYGVPLSWVRPLVERWRDDFDWREQEARLNRFPQFTTDIDGQTIHFVHVRSPEPDATPLMLTHGWPNTFTEYLDLVGPLTDPRSYGGDPADAFHVVIPSYPGFAFSGPTTQAGWTPERMARAFAELMRRLGSDRYGVHGNDGGAIVSPYVGRVDPDRVIGVHVNQIFSFPTGAPGELDALTEDELTGIRFGQKFLEHAIHDHAQKGQPQTLGHALADSPYGQLAWIGQLLAGSVEPDEILTIASIYWFTNTAASSARFYYEDAHQPDTASAPTSVPLGLASFGFDFRAPRRLAERDHANIVQWNEYDHGGHWAAHEAPETLTADIRGFFRTLR
ncbi:MAG TPA: epoxide hydrolase [Actinocatenispora sp.]